MTEVTAAIARASPNLRSQIAAARSIGSNGRSIGLRTAQSYLCSPRRPRQIHLRPADHVLDTHDHSKLYSLLGEFVTVTLTGGDMESGHAVTAVAPVLCAGVGVRSDSRWALRMASFRLDQSDLGGAALGIATPRSPAATALIGLLSGQIAADYGSMHVLGHDMAKKAGRAAVRRQTGVATRGSRPVAGTRIRALIDRAARKSG